MIRAALVLALMTGPAPAQDCTFVRDPVHICPSTAGWFELGPFGRYGPDAALMRLGGPNAVIISAPLGSAPLDGRTLTLDALEATALQALATAEGAAPPPRVLLREAATLLDMDWRTTVYISRIAGLPVVYANTMTITESHAIQLITVSHDVAVYSDAHRADHALFLSLIRLEA